MSISIITSLYRSEKYLKDYLSSIVPFADMLQKQGVTFEFILVSNNQNKSEAEILTPYLVHSWLRVICVPRETLYASWNRGIRESRSTTCTFWNVDDVRLPEAILDGLKRIKGGKELVYFPFRYKRYVRVLNFKILAKNVLILPPKFTRDEFIRSMNCGPFFMFTKELYEKNGPFDENFTIAGDFDWCVRATLITDFDLSEEVGGVFTNEGTSLSGSRGNVLQEENNRIYQKNGILNKIHNL